MPVVDLAATLAGDAVDADAITSTQDVQSPGITCRVSTRRNPGSLNVSGGPQSLNADLGEAGSLVRVYTGTTGGASPSRPGPLQFANEITGRGLLNRLNEAPIAARSFSGEDDSHTVTPWNDTTLVIALLELAGLNSSQYAVSGRGIDLVQAQALVVGRAEGDVLRAIRDIDAVTNCLTFDGADGIVYRIVWPVGLPDWAYTTDAVLGAGERPCGIGLSHEQLYAGVKEAVKVLGLKYPRTNPTYGVNRPHAARRADPIYADAARWLRVESPLVETTAHAEQLAEWLMDRNNVLGPVVPVTDPQGNTALQIGDIVTLDDADLGLDGASGVVVAVSHEGRVGSLQTRFSVALSGGPIGDPYILPPTVTLATGGTTTVTVGWTTTSEHYGSLPNTWTAEATNDQTPRKVGPTPGLQTYVFTKPTGVSTAEVEVIVREGTDDIAGRAVATV